ncbi:hypothetical protein AX279_17770 [Pseudomonas sp. J237]|nr:MULTISPECIES: hypothetical protein [Pseudomonas]OEO24516.1 hypothetical protein AX279_17770 [Pseudomonas sp. J237]
MAITLQSVICPACAEELARDNRGCIHCGYQDHVAGRILSLQEMAELPSYPAPNAASFDDVSPGFIAAVITAARVGHQPS